MEVSENNGGLWTPLAMGAWGITYRNNLDTDNAILGSRKLYSLPVGNADCEVRFTPRVTLNTFYRRALAADPDDLALRMTATGSAGEVIQVTVHSVEITDAPAAVSGADVLKGIEITGRARLNPSDSKFVTIAVTNSVATYL